MQVKEITAVTVATTKYIEDLIFYKSIGKSF